MIRHSLQHTAVSLVAVLALSTVATSASAAVVTFSGLSGDIGDALGPYSEGGFTVIPQFGAWKEGHVTGSPVPSVYVQDFTDTPFGSLQITADNAALFSFNSVDLSVFNSPVGYEIAGWRDGEQVFSIATSQGPTSGFVSIGGAQPLVDRLTIDIGGGGPGSFNVDNINVTAVPEPGTLTLGAAGLAIGVGAVARRRARRLSPPWSCS